MKQNIPIVMNQVPNSTKGPIRYSQRYKDILQKLSPPIQKPHPTPKPLSLYFYRIRSIGVGAYSFVYLVSDQQTISIYAQKSINKKHLPSQLFLQIKLHLALNHSNIVHLYHIYSEQGYVHLIMDYAGQSLFVLRKFGKIPHIMPQQQIVSILKQIINAVSYLHAHEIVHADIKLQNILYQQGVIKLCDLGYAHISKKQKNHNQYQQLTKFNLESQPQNLQFNCVNKEVVGTLEYLDPEYVQGKVSEFSRDIWAIGIVAYELLVGRNPFDGLSQNQKWSTLLKISSIPSQSLNLSKHMQSFLSSTLCPISQRASIQQLSHMSIFRKQCLSSSYLLDQNQIKIIS